MWLGFGRIKEDKGTAPLRRFFIFWIGFDATGPVFFSRKSYPQLRQKISSGLSLPHLGQFIDSPGPCPEKLLHCFCTSAQENSSFLSHQDHNLFMGFEYRSYCIHSVIQITGRIMDRIFFRDCLRVGTCYSGGNSSSTSARLVP
jgi:hypothetical protein